MSLLDPLPAEGKPAVQSVTLWGALAALVGLIVPPVLAHYGVGSADAQEATKDLGDIIVAVGSLVAIVGRAKGNTPLPPITSFFKKES
jgi:hypothetical protein